MLWVGRASTVPHLDPSLRIEAVQPGDVADHAALEARIFGLAERDSEFRRAQLSEALRRGGLRAYLVRIDGEAVAVARLSQGEGVAGLYGVGVAESWRGRGIGAAHHHGRNPGGTGDGQPARLAVGR